MENNFENMNKSINESTNEHNACFFTKIVDFFHKNLTIIAILLSIVSIIFSSFALIKSGRHNRRDLRIAPPEMRCEMQNNNFNFDPNNAPNGRFNKGPNVSGNSGSHKRGSFNDGSYYGQKPNKNNDFKPNFDNQNNMKPDKNFNGMPNNNIKNDRPGKGFDNNHTNDNGPITAPEISPDKPNDIENNNR